MDELAAFLAPKVDSPAQAWRTPGTYHRWARQWATDSVRQSNAAYQGLEFGQATFEDDDRLQEIETTLPPNYSDNQKGRATDQLAKASFHLKELLNNIEWK